MTRRIARTAVVHHLLRVAGTVLALAVFPAAAPVLGIALYLALFMLNHELMHGALGLPRRRNELAFAVTATLMATAGHALRLTHMIHHARPLADDDYEGAAARLTPWRALVAAPRLAALMVLAGWRHAGPAQRRWQVAEYAAIAALLLAIAVAGNHALQICAAETILLQVFAPFWADHIPHRKPAWLFAVARPLARAGLMTMLNLVEHEAHHAAPKLPMAVHNLAA